MDLKEMTRKAKTSEEAKDESSNCYKDKLFKKNNLKTNSKNILKSKQNGKGDTANLRPILQLKPQ